MDNKFIILRDHVGTVQLVVDRHNGVYKSLCNAPLESALCVEGVVKLRPDDQVSSKMATGHVEVEVDRVRSVGKCRPSLPFYIRPHSEAGEHLRLQHRYLDLRHARMQKNLRFRADLTLAVRNFLAGNGFVDVETPSLFRRTPGGAQEFVVPSRQPGKFYTLVQSPQQFKQMLMVGGINRYYQIARCYRDEAGRTDRQPEFTQIDIEMAFTDADRVIGLVEQMMRAIWPPDVPPLPAGPFQRLDHEEAMRRYGSDKPDLRVPNEIVDVTDIVAASGTEFYRESKPKFVKCLAFSADELSPRPTKKDWAEIVRAVKDQHAAISAGDLMVSNFSMGEGDVQGSLVRKLVAPADLENFRSALGVGGGKITGIVAAADDENGALVALGTARSRILKRHVVDKGDFKILWVVNFPLFVRSNDGQGIESAHHPFTRPHPDDVALLYDRPLSVRGQHYDLVLNGQEIGGGSMRIHDADMQRRVFRDILGEATEGIEHMLDALGCGCPPHGGIALGLDRLVAILCRAPSIRDVIAFPKSSDGTDPMSGAPAAITKDDHAIYHLKE